jgi:hypothetical protein
MLYLKDNYSAGDYKEKKREKKRVTSKIFNIWENGVRESDKLNRDILLYLSWQEGKYTNFQIGNLLGLTHSAVSRRVAITRNKITLEQSFN